MKKILIALLIIAVAVLISLSVIFLKFQKFILESAIAHELGTRVTIGEIAFDLDKEGRSLLMKEFVVYNPPGFDQAQALSYLPEITAWYDLKTLIKDNKLHVKRLNVNMKMLNVVKNKDGAMNVNALRFSLEKFDMLPMELDELLLKVDSVVFKDYTKGKKPTVQAYNVNIKAKSFEDIPSVDATVNKIVMEALSKTAIEGFGIFGVVAIAGSSVVCPVILPVGIGLIMAAEKDSYTVTMETDYENVYQASLKAAGELGEKISENKESGIIKSNMQGSKVTIKIVSQSEKETKVTVSARSLLGGKPEIAGGVICEIYQNLKPAKSKRK